MDKRTEIQDEVVNSLPPEPHGLLNYTMRFGKGRVVCKLLVKNNYKKVLWVTVDAKLRDIDIPKEFETWIPKDYKFDKVDIICYQSLGKTVGEYDVIILDEYQHITPANSKSIFNGKLKYRKILGITGTPPKHYHKKRILENLLLFEIDGMSIDEAVDNDIVADYTITTVPVKLNNSDLTVMAGSKSRPFYTTEEKDYNFWDKKIKELEESGEETKFLRIKRANCVYNSPSKLKKAKELISKLEGRTMIFSGSISGAEAISSNTYHSKTTKDNYLKFKNREINVLSCVNKGGIGDTFEGVDNFVIVQCNSNKMGDVTQKIGRALLKQDKNYKANIYILYLQGTVDEEWMRKVLQDFNPEKIINL